MKAKEVRDKYKCVGYAIHELEQEIFKALMDKEENYEDEMIGYNAVSRVDRAMQNTYLHICLIISRNPGAEAERSYMDELKATMNTVSKWLVEADTPAGKHAYAECLQVLVGAYMLERI